MADSKISNLPVAGTLLSTDKLVGDFGAVPATKTVTMTVLAAFLSTLMSFFVTWKTKTGNYTAVAGDYIAADTTGGVFTITLPSFPTAGQPVDFSSGPLCSTNNLTIARNGQTIMSTASDLTVSTNNVQFTLVFDGTTWRL